jgi:hypothetical protein
MPSMNYFNIVYIPKTKQQVKKKYIYVKSINEKPLLKKIHIYVQD